jgi:hypothetical protein
VYEWHRPEHGMVVVANSGKLFDLILRFRDPKVQMAEIIEDRRLLWTSRTRGQ